MTEPPHPPASDIDWDAVLVWLPRLTATGFQAGVWKGGEETTPGVSTFPFVRFSAEVEAFVSCLYEQQVVAGFDWSAWVDRRGRALTEDPEQLSAATLEDCRMLLAAHVRADRFIEGHLRHVFDTGNPVAVREGSPNSLTSQPEPAGDA